MSDFSFNLKKYRKRKNLSQCKLAKTLHYGCTAIANYESGRNEPSIDSLIKLAEALDVTIDELGGQKKTFYLMETEGHQRGTTRFVFYGYPIF